MPRYVLEARTISRARRDDASGLAATRFPEVLVDLRYAAHDQGGVDVWVCRAPSELHVRRWARAVGLDVRLLQPVETDPG